MIKEKTPRFFNPRKVPKSALVNKVYPTCECGQKYIPKVGCIFCRRNKKNQS